MKNERFKSRRANLVIGWSFVAVAIAVAVIGVRWTVGMDDRMDAVVHSGVDTPGQVMTTDSPSDGNSDTARECVSYTAGVLDVVDCPVVDHTQKIGTQVTVRYLLGRPKAAAVVGNVGYSNSPLEGMGLMALTLALVGLSGLWSAHKARLADRQHLSQETDGQQGS